MAIIAHVIRSRDGASFRGAIVEVEFVEEAFRMSGGRLVILVGIGAAITRRKLITKFELVSDELVVADGLQVAGKVGVAHELYDERAHLTILLFIERGALSLDKTPAERLELVIVDGAMVAVPGGGLEVGQLRVKRRHSWIHTMPFRNRDVLNTLYKFRNPKASATIQDRLEIKSHLLHELVSICWVHRTQARRMHHRIGTLASCNQHACYAVKMHVIFGTGETDISYRIEANDIASDSKEIEL